MMATVEEVTAIEVVQAEEVPGDAGAHAAGEIVEYPVVTVVAQNLQVTAGGGKTKVTFEVENPHGGVGIGKLARMAIIGTCDVVLRSHQAELPL